MSFAAIRKAYHVPAAAGVRVLYQGQPGTITGAVGHCLIIQLDGEENSKVYHPTINITYPVENRLARSDPFSADISDKSATLFAVIFNHIAKKCHQNAAEKGFWDDPDRSDEELLALIHSEISETLEACREGNPPSTKLSNHSSAVEELADCIIRIMDMAHSRGWDLGQAIVDKHRYNRTRPHRHGKQF